MKQKVLSKYNVIVTDPITGNTKYKDILPYLREQLSDLKKRIAKEKRRVKPDINLLNSFPSDKNSMRDFILKEAHHIWWSRCEYEILILDWPCQKTTTKIDVYDQVEMNIDVITDILFNEIN